MELSRRAFLGLAAAGPFVLRHRVVDAAVDPAVVGSWSPRVKMPHIGIHMFTLPGRPELLIASSKYGGPKGTIAWTWDPSTNIIADATMQQAFNFMCGGGILDEIGWPRVYGGTNGNDRSFWYKASTRTWIEGKRMSTGRYYPTSVRGGYTPSYPNGFIITAVGQIRSLDIYDAHDNNLTTKMTRMPTSADLPELGYQTQYPRLHLLPSGLIAMLGCEKVMKTFNVETATWTNGPTMLFGGRRYEGCATRLPGDGNEFLLTGGDTYLTNKRQERVNMLTGAQRETATMRLARRQANTAILPDGTILVLGGIGTPQPNVPELFNPYTDTLVAMADTPTQTLINGVLVNDKPAYRGYHSTAICRRGRVSWTGGVAGSVGMSSEVFTPPQLYRGPQPVLACVPGSESVALGGVITFSTEGSLEPVTRVTLIRHSHNSHGHNGEQQLYDLPFSEFPGGVVATIQANPNLMPPGWYEAYGLTATGVWSQGTDIKILRV